MSRLAAQPKRAKTPPRDADEPRPFVPGTTGWSVADLDDPRIERLWFAGAYEIIEGVLTTMPPAYYFGNSRLRRLERQVERRADRLKLKGQFANEIDIVLHNGIVVRADSVWMTPQEEAANIAAGAGIGKSDETRLRVYVPPTLVIESVSPGHELHDRRTKLAYYAGFRVPHYWIFDALRRSLDCYVLERKTYVLAAAGTSPAKVAVPFFDGLKIDLGAIFDED